MLSLKTTIDAVAISSQAARKDVIKAQSLPVKVSTPKATSKLETSSKDDKKPEESLNSGEIHIKEALEEIKTFDIDDKDSAASIQEVPKLKDIKLSPPLKAPTVPA